MSTSISNLSISLPISSRRDASAALSLIQFGFSHLKVRSHGRSLKAMAAERRENLDHLQKANSRQPTQAKQRMAQVTPVGIWDCFPTAWTVQQMIDTMERIMEDPSTYPLMRDEGIWDRFPTARTVQQMIDIMERIMEDPSTYPLMREEGGGYRRGRTPWEIKEGENEYKMRFDMPGMTKKDFRVWVEEKMLVVKVENKQMRKRNGLQRAMGDIAVELHCLRRQR